MHKTKRRFKELLVKYIASVSLTLNVLLVVSFIVVVLHDFVFTGRPELFEGGAQVWDLVYRLSLALIGSYIFYFVVVHLKRQQDKENLRPFLQRQTNFAIGDAKLLAHTLKEESGYDFAGDYPSLADTQIMCAKIRLNDEAPLVVDERVEEADDHSGGAGDDAHSFRTGSGATGRFGRCWTRQRLHPNTLSKWF